MAALGLRKRKCVAISRKVGTSCAESCLSRIYLRICCCFCVSSFILDKCPVLSHGLSRVMGGLWKERGCPHPRVPKALPAKRGWRDPGFLGIGPVFDFAEIRLIRDSSQSTLSHEDGSLRSTSRKSRIGGAPCRSISAWNFSSENRAPSCFR